MTHLIEKLTKNDTFSSLFIMGMRGGMLVGKLLLALFIARYMGLETLGLYGLIIVVSGTLQVLIRFGMFDMLVREAVHDTKENLTVKLRHYYTGIFLMYSVIIPVIIGLGYHHDKLDIAILASCILVLEHMAFDIFALISYLLRPRVANILLSLQSALWIYLYVVLAFFIPSMRTLETMMLFWISGSLLMVLLALYASRAWPWKAAFAQKIQWGWHKRNIKRSYNIYAAEVLSMLNLYTDRYLITFFLNMEILGVYILFAQITNAISNLITSGVMQVYKPRLILAFRNGEVDSFHKQYYTCLVRSLSGGFVISLASGIIVPFLITYTDQPLALHYLPLLGFMLAANLIRMGSEMAKNYLYTTHQDVLTLKTNLIIFLFSVMVGSAALYFIGIYGVALNTAIVYTVAIFYVEWRKTRFKSRLA